MTGEVETVPTDKASRIKARKALMNAGDPPSERKGTKEGPGRSFRTPEVHTYSTLPLHGMHMRVLVPYIHMSHNLPPSPEQEIALNKLMQHQANLCKQPAGLYRLSAANLNKPKL